MSKKVEIKKTVFDRNEYVSVIDNKFKFFKEPEPVVDPDTIEELFRLYDKLYVSIPIEGEDRSHQYLVERSSELYKIDTQLESIQPLLDEVASLRNQILESNRRILELETQLAGGGELNFEDAEQMQLLRTQLETANATIATLEQANSLANRATEMASKQAEEAAKKAADAAEKSAAAQAEAQAVEAKANTGAAAQEIVALMSKKKKGQLYYAKIFLEKPKNYWWRIAGRNRRYVGYGHSSYWRTNGRNFFWFFSDDEDAREYYSVRRRRGYGRANYFTYLVPVDRNQAGDMTLDFLVDELKQAGYNAHEIKAGFEGVDNFKNNVRTRIITFKDPDKEDELGYTFID